MTNGSGRQNRFYVARHGRCGCVAVVVADDELLPNEEKADMVRGCIESGLKVDRLTLDQLTAMLMAQRDCEHPMPDDELPDDIPFDEDDDDDDSDIPF